MVDLKADELVVRQHDPAAGLHRYVADLIAQLNGGVLAGHEWPGIADGEGADGVRAGLLD
jgi:hypothetical protein